MMNLRRKKIEILEDKSKFANDIRDIWSRENYDKIKSAHNEIVEYLHDKEFDFFSMQYLLTMTYMELLLTEYMDSHKSEITGKLKALIEEKIKVEP